MGSPFSDIWSDLLVMDTRDLTDPVVIESLYHKLGQDQYNSYVSELWAPGQSVKSNHVSHPEEQPSFIQPASSLWKIQVSITTHISQKLFFPLLRVIHSQHTSGSVLCMHEEVDICILCHLEFAVKEGYTTASLCTVDTDVLVIAVTAAQRTSTSLSYGLYLELGEVSGI